LGPGVRPQGLEYNIGSLKFLSSLEYRFNVVGSLKSALFIDAGNIWDITNSPLVDDASRFTNIECLDLGFKLREPYLENKKWFQETNFSNVIYNIGINYPF